MLGKLKISARLYIGFLSVIGLLGVVSVAAVWVFNSVSGDFKLFNSSATVATSSVQLDRDVVHFRRQVFEYFVSPDEDKYKAITSAAQDVRQRLSILGGQITDPAQRGDYDLMTKSFEAYMQDLDKVVVVLVKRGKVVKDQIEPGGSALLAALSAAQGQARARGDHDGELALSGAKEDVLLARLAVARYIDTASPEYSDKARQNLKDAQTALAAVPGRAEAEKLMSSYMQAFETLIPLAAERAAYLDKLKGTGLVIAEKAQSIKEKGIADQVQVTAQTTERLSSAKAWIIGLAVVALLVGVTLAWAIAQGIVTPVTAMTRAMSRLAEGDKTAAIPAQDRGDEIGEMAKAVQVFKDNAIEMERLQTEQEEMKRKAEAERRRTMLSLADNFEASVKGVVEGVSSMATEMQATAGAMSATAEQTSRQSMAVAAAAEEASTNVQTVASAAEELSSSIHEISRQVAQSTTISQNAVDEAERTNSMVQGLADAAAKIGEVVSLINDIASQTNLLALNATIEAARAGDAGKGFAVVANEVKSLANQTAKATEEISAQINAVQGATRDAVEAIHGIGQTIAQISEIASAIAAAVEEQGAATQEIARNVSQAAQGTQDVTSNITGVTQAAGETGHAANEVLNAASDLSQQSEQLRSQVELFLNSIRNG